MCHSAAAGFIQLKSISSLQLKSAYQVDAPDQSKGGRANGEEDGGFRAHLSF